MPPFLAGAVSARGQCCRPGFGQKVTGGTGGQRQATQTSGVETSHQAFRMLFSSSKLSIRRPSRSGRCPKVVGGPPTGPKESRPSLCRSRRTATAHGVVSSYRLSLFRPIETIWQDFPILRVLPRKICEDGMRGVVRDTGVELSEQPCRPTLIPRHRTRSCREALMWHARTHGSPDPRKGA